MRSLIEYVLALTVIVGGLLLACHAVHGMWEVWFVHRRHMSVLAPVLCAAAALLTVRFGQSRMPHTVFG